MENADDDMDDRDFWMAACSVSMARIWDNPEDDVSAELLQDSLLDREQSIAEEPPSDVSS